MEQFRMRSRVIVLFICWILASCGGAPTVDQSAGSHASSPVATISPAATASRLNVQASIQYLNLPAGFQSSIYARNLNAPRFLSMGPQGSLLVAERTAGQIVALLPGSSPLQAKRTVVIIKGLDDPTTLALQGEDLYIGERTAIARLRLGVDLHTGALERIITGLPRVGNHTTRTVFVGPDQHLYVSIGSDCNVCIESDKYRATVWRYNLDGSGGEAYAKGLRNAVGLALNPWNQQIWLTNNGRDLLGNDLPPETVYRLVKQGDYGWPRCHAGTEPDPEFGQAAGACQGVEQPLVKMQAHSAPLGLAFYPPTVDQFPKAYQDSLYIAFHGSWNRSIPTGYKIVRVPLSNGKVAGPAEDFITGWLNADGTTHGRPVDVVFAPDGTLFISDDNANVVYHVWYHG